MSKKISLVSKISLTSGLALAIAFAVWCSVAAQAADEKHDAHHELHLNHITLELAARPTPPASVRAETVRTRCLQVLGDACSGAQISSGASDLATAPDADGPEDECISCSEE